MHLVLGGKGGLYCFMCSESLLESAKLMKTSYQKANKDLVPKVFSHFDMQSSYSCEKIYVHYIQDGCLRNTSMVNVKQLKNTVKN